MAASENGGDPEDEMSEGQSVKQHRQREGNKAKALGHG